MDLMKIGLTAVALAIGFGLMTALTAATVFHVLSVLTP